MKTHRSRIIRRLSALLLALFLLASQTGALAMPASQALSLSLAYQAADGSRQSLLAQPINQQGYEDALWLYISPEAQQDAGALLVFADVFSQYPGGFMVQPNTAVPPEGLPAAQYYVQDAGGSLSGQPLLISALDANGSQVAQFRLFISLAKEMPDPPEVVVQPADVAISYLDQNGSFITSETRTLNPGDHNVEPNASLLPANYQLDDQPSKPVTVNEFGANPSSLEFRYKLVIPAAEVTINYIDQNGSPITSETRSLEVGDHNVEPNASLLPANYQLDDQASKPVTVNEFGANPNSLEFRYKLVIPAAEVTISYLDQNGSPITSETRSLEAGDHSVEPNASLLPANYQLDDQPSKLVTVNEFGANPASLEFRYKLVIPAAEVTINYIDQNGSPITSETRSLEAGDHSVEPNASLLPANYQLDDQPSKPVTVNEFGANPASLEFRYKLVIPAAEVTISYLDQNGSPITSETRSLEAGDHNVEPNASLLPANYQLDDQPSKLVTVNELGANPASLEFRYKLVIPAAEVTINYIDQNGNPITSETRSLEAGDHNVEPNASLLPANYQLDDQPSKLVTVNEFGANPASLEFRYKLVIPAAEVTINYIDQNGSPITSETRSLEAGDHNVEPNASLLPANYQLDDQPSKLVTVNELGANPASLEFRYKLVVAPADITVRYVDHDGKELASEVRRLEPGTTIVSPNPDLVPADYTLTSPAEVQVTVDAQGADQPLVTFTFQAPAVITEQPVQPANVNIHFRDEQGKPVAPSKTLILPEGSTEVYAQPEGLPQGYALQGPDVQTVTVDRQGAHPAEVIFIYKAPEATEEPIQPALVKVEYVDQAGNLVADSQEITLQPGKKLIKPTPVNLLPGYELDSPQEVEVEVGRAGASINPVRFIYKLTAPVSQPVQVLVHYVDEAGQPVASDTKLSLGEGKHPVKPQPADLKEGYALLPGEDQAKYVTVTQNTATPASLQFVYKKVEAATPTPAPAPKAALVNVVYKNEAGEQLHASTAPCEEGKQTVITADLSRINQDLYQLVGQDSYTITVDAAGNPSQREVVFLFKDISVKTATIKLHYRDESGRTLAPSQQVDIKEGSHPIAAQPEGLPQGYVLQSQSPVTVTLSQSGALSQAEVVFVYQLPPTPSPTPSQTPEPTVLPFDVTSMDRYAYPIGTNINFRSSPDSSSKTNVLSTVGEKDLAHVMGSVKNKQGEEWYLVDIAGQEGFLKASVARLLDWGEVAALFGWTPSPSPEVQPSQDPFKDGEIIDRWAEVTSKGGVNLRAKANSSSTKIRTLERGQRFWVYTQQTVGKEIWYSVMADGKAGFVSAAYVRLFTHQESQQYQATLASPMPYAATATPTVAPATTQPPVTATPTAVVTATATPASYHGPALTTRQTALRTGVASKDEPVLEMLEVNALVQIWSQTWIGSESWSQVQVMADMQVGYVPTASLRYINEQEAAFYRDQLSPQAPPSQSPTRQPEQRTGYSSSRGENVPMRAFPDTNAQIIALLPEGAVVAVRGQEYVAGAAWDVVQYGAAFGYVRSDQLRMMSAAEQTNYLNSLFTPTPAPAASPEPVTLNSPSSYGYVKADRVRLRSGPSTSSQEIKLMNKNAFALVYGSSQEKDGTWYHISQDGTVGYIHGDFFTVLPMGELSSYLQSPDYLNANSGKLPVNGGYQQQGQITPLENYNNTVWKNPSLVNASYEPFNPLGTPTPPVEAIKSPDLTPSPTPTATLMTVEGFEEPPAEKTSSGFPGGLLAIGLVALLGGGGYYAYHLYNQNQKRAAARAAQRRAQAAQQAGQPQARPAAPQQTSAFTPPRPGQAGQPGQQPPRPGQQPPQATTAYRPVQPGQAGQPGQQPPQATTAYRPVQPGQAGQPGQQPPQATTAYRPVQPGQAAQPGQQPPQATTAYRPVQPGQTGQPGQQPPQATTAYRPVQPGQAGQQPPSQGQQAPAKEQGQAPEQRRRRSDRHGNS